ncbi:hypothetical protein LCGC14_2473210, partial [marine sediment metagenome]
MVLTDSSGKALPQLTSKLKLRQRTGFFDSFETPQKRLRRLNLLKLSATRTKTQNVLKSASVAARAAQFREISERNIRETEESVLKDNEKSSGLLSIGARLAETIQTARDTREARERAAQAVDIEASRRRFRSIEAENSLLTQDQASAKLNPPRNKELDKNLERFRREEAKNQPPGKLAELMDRYLPKGTKLVIKGKNEARFNEETGFVEVSRDLLESPGAAGILAHEGAHAVEKGLSDRAAVMSRLRKAWGDLPN